MAQRIEEEVANIGDPLHDEQVHPLKENANVDQPPANPPPMTEVDKRDILAQMAQAITTHVQASTVQDKVMTSQSNRDVAPHPHQHVTTMASRIRHFI